MSEVQVSFSLWYPGAYFWSHPFWYWYMVMGVALLMAVIVCFIKFGAQWRDGSPKLHQFALVAFFWPYWVARAMLVPLIMWMDKK